MKKIHMHLTVHFSHLCCVLHTCQVIFFFVTVLILSSLLGVFSMWTVFRIHKPVIWLLLNILVVCMIVRSVCLWSALSHAWFSHQGKNPCYPLQELSLSHAMLWTKCHLWLLMYALLQCNVPRIFTLHICKTDMVLQMKMAEYKGGGGLYNGTFLVKFYGKSIKTGNTFLISSGYFDTAVYVCIYIYIYIYIVCIIASCIFCYVGTMSCARHVEM